MERDFHYIFFHGGNISFQQGNSPISAYISSYLTVIYLCFLLFPSIFFHLLTSVHDFLSGREFYATPSYFAIREGIYLYTPLQIPFQPTILGCFTSNLSAFTGNAWEFAAFSFIFGNILSLGKYFLHQ
jgi:hypothetical protein